MKSQVSPAAAGVIIVVLIAVAGLAIWKFTASGNRKQQPPESVRVHLLGASAHKAATSDKTHP